MKKESASSENLLTRQAWDGNAEFWDKHMGEGNDFVNILQWPAILRLLDPRPGQQILDIATGNGLTARRLAVLGAHVTAFDFSDNLIGIAKGKDNPGGRIQYLTIDASDENALLSLGEGEFDSGLCNMALFDMADIQPLFAALPRLLKPGGFFVFTLTHPAFNNSSALHGVEEIYENGDMRDVYSVKVSRYLTPYSAEGIAIRGQPNPQLYFERPIQAYLQLGFEYGFVVDGFEECAFPPDHPQKYPLSWGGKFSEIPPVLVVRMRLPRAG